MTKNSNFIEQFIYIVTIICTYLGARPYIVQWGTIIFGVYLGILCNIIFVAPIGSGLRYTLKRLFTVRTLATLLVSIPVYQIIIFNKYTQAILSNFFLGDFSVGILYGVFAESIIFELFSDRFRRKVLDTVSNGLLLGILKVLNSMKTGLEKKFSKRLEDENNDEPTTKNENKDS